MASWRRHEKWRKTEASNNGMAENKPNGNGISVINEIMAHPAALAVTKAKIESQTAKAIMKMASI
jgi:hypothetical protein